VRIHKRIAGHYAVQEVPFGKDYRWSPETVVLECSKCGKKTTHKRSEIIDSDVISCECGNKSNTARVREELVIQQLDEEEYEAHHRPWRHDAKARAKQRSRDEGAYPEDSAWRYNDVTTRNEIEE
jgi:DNA-directed RNA polymerase subunit RPC12/RpoP